LGRKISVLRPIDPEIGRLSFYDAIKQGKKIGRGTYRGL